MAERNHTLLVRGDVTQGFAVTAANDVQVLGSVFDAAVLLGVDAVCGFVGRNADLEMDQNLDLFEAR